MRKYRNNVMVTSIFAIIWSLAEIILCAWSHKTTLQVLDIKEEILLAYDIHQCIVYAMVLISGVLGIIATIKKNSWKFSVAVGGFSLLISIVIPLMTRVPLNVATVVFSIMIPYGIFRMYRKNG